MATSDEAPGLRERKKQQTRERLSASAFRLFHELGYEGATVELIAEDAEVSVTTFFRYYESKEDVFLSSIREVIERIEAAIRDRASGVSVLAALRAILGEVLGEIDRAGDHVGMKRLDAVPELHERIREYEDRVRSAIAEAYAAQLGGPPSDLRPKMLSEAVCGSFEAARSAWLNAPGTGSLREHMSDALDIAERMIRPILRST